MAFLVQLDDGSIDQANAYVTVQEYKDYLADRGISTTGQQSTSIEDWIVQSSDYVDGRFRQAYVGFQLALLQRTAWPRTDAFDRNGFDVSNTIPQALKDAVVEYADRARLNALAPDPEIAATGKQVIGVREKVGPIEEETKYAAGGGIILFPPYPIADAIISSLLNKSRRTIRA